MKKSLFLYLFIVSVLMTVFTYMYYSKKVKFEAERFEKLKVKMNDSIQSLNNQVFEANYFTLLNNDNAQNYLEDYSIPKLISKIENINKPSKISLIFSLIKSSKLDYLIQKCTEVGVKSFSPVISEKSVAKNLNIQRIERIIKESCEQSNQLYLPTIHAV